LNKVIEIAFWAMFLGIAVGVSYSFAVLGEPQALWFWRDVLGVL
jgi:heme/copper-type cytochrome/quinol oxidase subunit 1